MYVSPVLFTALRANVRLPCEVGSMNVAYPEASWDVDASEATATWERPVREIGYQCVFLICSQVTCMFFVDNKAT